MPERGNKSKPKNIWMPLYVGDYLAETQLFTTEQHGAYHLIRMAYWDNRGPIPSSDEVLAAIARLPVQRWRKIKKQVVAKFDLRDGELHNDDLDAALDRATKMQKEASERGKIAANARWGNGNNLDASSMHGACPTHYPTQCPTHCPRYTSQSYSHKNNLSQGESSGLEVSSRGGGVDEITGEITGFGGAA